MDKPSHKFAFGVYEADPASGELRKNGMKVKIQEQPFQILLVLLEHPGEVITREDLRLRLWPADTFVDFDHGLNTAINKLREAVGDSASNPRFVETLARRGYRFIAPVKVLGTVDKDASVGTGLRPVPDGAEFRPHITTVQGGTEPWPQETTPVLAAPEPAANAEVALIPDPSSSTVEELPRPSRYISRVLFGLIQLMYLIFYGVALAKLEHIPEIAQDFLGRLTIVLIPLVLITAAVGISMRLYLFTAVTFDYKPLGQKFRKLFPAILPLDQLWALSPFLLAGHIGIGGAFAACAALLYVPFSERTLIRMGYDWK